MTNLTIKAQESRENMSIMTKMGKNRAQARNPILTPVKWSLCHPKSIARNLAQNGS